MMSSDSSFKVFSLKFSLKDGRWGLWTTRGRGDDLLNRRWSPYLHIKLRDHTFWVERNKPSPSESWFDVSFRHSSLKCIVKGGKELRLRNVGYRASYQMLYFSTICLFEHTKTPDVKRLKQMNEWGGIQSVIMLFSSQYISKSAEWWLPCPSRIRRR